MIAEFEAANPGIKVNWLQVPGVPGVMHTLYITNIAVENEQPDVLAIDVV